MRARGTVRSRREIPREQPDLGRTDPAGNQDFTGRTSGATLAHARYDVVGRAALVIVLSLTGAPAHSLCIAWCDVHWSGTPAADCHHGTTAAPTPAIVTADDCDGVPTAVLYVRESVPQAGLWAVAAHPGAWLAYQAGDHRPAVVDSWPMARAFPLTMNAVELRL